MTFANPESERARALEIHKSGDLEAAEAIYAALLAQDPEDGPTSGLLGLLRLQQGRAPEAKELLERACQLAPGEAKHHNNLGNAEMALGQPEAAEKAFSRAVEVEPGAADFHVNAATAKLARGRHEAAIAGFQRALEIESGNFRALHNLGSLLSRHNRVAEALPHLKAAAAHPACQAETLVNLASAYDRSGRLDEAEAVLSRVPEGASLPPPIEMFLTILRARHRRQRHDSGAALELLAPLEPHFAAGFAWPLLGTITGVFGSQRILNGEPRRPHYGVDIAGPRGRPVLSPAAGDVALAEADLYYTGGTIIIDHGFGLTSVLSHLSAVLVAVGQSVAQGQLVGRLGATGRATGPHLDWRVNWFAERLDPARLVPPMPKPEDG